MPLLLFVAFLVVPLVELFVIVQVQEAAGLGWTILALVVISVAGAVLVKREGLKAWRRFRTALEEFRLPAAEVVDGALLLFAGALLLTPGFVTDTVGFLLLLPPTRALANRGLRRFARGSLGLQGPPAAPRSARRPPTLDDSVDVEVVDVRRTDDAGAGDARPQGPQRDLP